MCAEAGIEGVVGGIGNKRGVIRPHGEERGESLNQCRSEALVDSRLSRKVPVVVLRGIKRVMRFSYIKSEDGRIHPGFVPMTQAHCLRELLAVDADFPGQ